MKYLILFIFSSLFIQNVNSQDNCSVCTNRELDTISGFPINFVKRSECARCLLPNWDNEDSWIFLLDFRFEDVDTPFIFYYNKTTINYNKTTKTYSVWIKKIENTEYQNLYEFEFKNINGKAQKKYLALIYLSENGVNVASSGYCDNEEYKDIPTYDCISRSQFIELKKIFQTLN